MASIASRFAGRVCLSGSASVRALTRRVSGSAVPPCTFVWKSRFLRSELLRWVWG